MNQNMDKLLLDYMAKSQNVLFIVKLLVCMCACMHAQYSHSLCFIIHEGYLTAMLSYT
jgi:hypothetical protein